MLRFTYHLDKSRAIILRPLALHVEFRSFSVAGEETYSIKKIGSRTRYDSDIRRATLRGNVCLSWRRASSGRKKSMPEIGAKDLDMSKCFDKLASSTSAKYFWLMSLAKTYSQTNLPSL